MKKIFLICSFLLSYFFLQAQFHDNIWIVDRPTSLNDNQSIKIDFSQSNPEVEIFPSTLQFNANFSTYCDSIGKMIACSNGNKIYNAELELMKAGNNIGGADYYSPSMFFLPFPDKTDKNILITQSGDWDTLLNGSRYESAHKIFQSTFDMSLDMGLGKVVEKSKLIAEGRFIKVSACKHANGRDWWLLCLDIFFRSYTVVLLDGEGFHNQGTFSLPTEIKVPYPVPNPTIFDDFTPKPIHTTFNNRGDKFMMSNEFSGIYVFDFDRCSGLLGDYLRLEQPLWAYVDWAVFSPNDRFIYSEGYNILSLSDSSVYYQFDLEADDVQDSRIIIGKNDNYDDPNISAQDYLGFLLPAADGRIYGVSNNNFLHTIHFPNRKGLGSTFKIRDMEFPPYHRPTQVFYYPNYRLGPIDSSSCDTLGLDNHPLAHFRYDVEDTLATRQLTFTDLSSYEPATWSWDFGDPASGAANMSSDTSPVHVFSGPGVYQVCQTVCNVNSCDTECKEVVLGTISTVDGGRKTVDGEFQVFPNPVQDELNIHSQKIVDFNMEVQLFDIAGRLLFSKKLQKRTATWQIEVKELTSGLYFYEVKNETGLPLQSGKVVKE